MVVLVEDAGPRARAATPRLRATASGPAPARGCSRRARSSRRSRSARRPVTKSGIDLDGVGVPVPRGPRTAQAARGEGLAGAPVDAQSGRTQLADLEELHTVDAAPGSLDLRVLGAVARAAALADAEHARACRVVDVDRHVRARARAAPRARRGRSPPSCRRPTRLEDCAVAAAAASVVLGPADEAERGAVAERDLRLDVDGAAELARGGARLLRGRAQAPGRATSVRSGRARLAGRLDQAHVSVRLRPERVRRSRCWTTTARGRAPR